MQDYYHLLGINNSASETEIRRAYRILARRYHPDVNPGKQAAEKFKSIAEAYRTLIDETRRREYERNFAAFKQASIQKKYAAFKGAQQDMANASRAKSYYQNQKKDFENIKAFTRPPPAKQKTRLALQNFWRPIKRDLQDLWLRLTGKLKSFKPHSGASSTSSKNGDLPSKISIIEVSVSLAESIQGIRKTIEIEEPDGIRRIRVQIPAGVRSGSVVRMRSNTKGREELVLIVRVAQHPFMQIDARGLVVDIPVTLTEAFLGASIKVPTADGDPIMLKIPAGSQSGDELRVRNKGILEKNERGDIIYRIMVQHPGNQNDPELQKRMSELGLFYSSSLRKNMPKTLLEAARIR